MKSEVKISGKQLQVTRTFNAPRRAVFACWSDAEKLRLWSGCKEAVACEIEMDFRAGGSFTQKMLIKGCGEFTVTGKYLEIVEPQRIVYDADIGHAITRVTVEFFEEGGQTTVVLTQEGLPNDFLCDTVSQGTTESFEKLHSLLERGAATNQAARVSSL